MSLDKVANGKFPKEPLLTFANVIGALLAAFAFIIYGLNTKCTAKQALLAQL